MAKYSTGNAKSTSSSDVSEGACELCGTDSDSLQTVKVSGATLQACSSCANHNDNATKQDGDDGERDDSDPVGQTDDNSKDRRTQHLSENGGYLNNDTSHWEQNGTNYEDDQLPYLVSGYAKSVTDARKARDLSQGELAEEVDTREELIQAIETNSLRDAGVGGELLSRVETFLEIEIIDNPQ